MTLQTGNNRHRTPGVWGHGLPVRRGRPAGLLLAEVLMSVVLLASGAVLLMQGLARIAHGVSVGEQRSAAYLFALSKMTDLELQLRAGRRLEPSDAGQFRVQDRAFTWHISATSTGEDPDVQAVTLTVTWPTGQDTSEQQLATLLRAPPIPE